MSRVKNMNKALEPFKEPKLTLKQKKFLQVYFKTGNATKATLAAYDTDDPKTASTMGAENLVKLGDVVKRMMERKGLDLEKIIDTVNGAVDATKWNDFTGEREADHATRLKAVDVAERWLGLKQENKDTTIAVQFNNYADITKQQKEKYGA